MVPEIRQRRIDLQYLSISPLIRIYLYPDVGDGNAGIYPKK
jgi:hypothetical protein